MTRELYTGEEKIAPKKDIYVGAINQETGFIEGFYIEGIHGKEKVEEILADGGVPLTTELWQELLTYGQAKVDIETLSTLPITMEEGDEFGYDMSHIEYFSKVEPEVSKIVAEPTEVELLGEKVKGLEEKLDQILNTLKTK